MDQLQIAFYPDATSVALVVAKGAYWLWFTTGPERRMRLQLIGGDQLGDAAAGDFGDGNVAGQLEARMQAAGYELQRSAIQSGDIAVWNITPSRGYEPAPVASWG